MDYPANAVWILLLRHGIAIDREDPACPTDPERYLTHKGISRTEVAVAGLATLGLDLKAIYASPYVRAQQTAEIARHALGVAQDLVTTEALLPYAEAEAITAELRTAGTTDIALVGHAPNLDHVLAHLVGADQPISSLKKAGAALLDSRTPPGRGSAYLFALYPPSVLRSLA